MGLDIASRSTETMFVRRACVTSGSIAIRRIWGCGAIVIALTPGDTAAIHADVSFETLLIVFTICDFHAFAGIVTGQLARTLALRRHFTPLSAFAAFASLAAFTGLATFAGLAAIAAIAAHATRIAGPAVVTSEAEKSHRK
jgi:hypothetical protein